MIAVIFEVRPAERQIDRYLGIAAELKPMLERTQGFVSVERFQSLADPGKLLSLSFFRDEDAVRSWRETAEHRAAQVLGRSGVLADYQLRVARVVRDYSSGCRDGAPTDSLLFHGALGAAATAGGQP
jgi:heme-degrading monooxygenase HmoA